MKKILMIANYKPGSGGISSQVDLLTSCLQSEGYEVGVFNTKGNVVYRLVCLFRLLRKGRDFDVFHIHTCSYWGFLTAVYGVVAGKYLGKRIVLTYHGGGADSFFKKRKRLVRHFLLKTDVNVVLSVFLGKVFDEYLIPYTIIPNVVELDANRFKERETIHPRFISIRTLYPLYNIECVLRAYGRVKSKYAESSLLIVGDGPLKEALQQYVKEHDLQDVIFTGRVENSAIYDYLDRADIMLSASRTDNMPVSVLEGMNAGLLVISSRVGGVPYMIEDGQNGLLFQSDNDAELAEKIFIAIKEQGHSKAMIVKARRSMDKYSWKSVGEQLLWAYGFSAD